MRATGAFPYDFILKRVVWKSIVIFLTIAWCLFAIVSLPLTIVLVALLHLYRYTVAKTAQWYRSDLGKMLTTSSSLIAATGVHKNPEETILLTYVLEGEPSTEELAAYISDRLVYAKKNEGWAYPELQQYVTTHCGFYFWKWEEKFDVRNHLKVYNEFGMQDPEGKKYRDGPGLVALRQKLLTAVFAPKRSPWEFVVVRDFEGEESKKQTAVVFRIHHCLVDGYSLLKLILTRFAGKSVKEIRIPDKPQVSRMRIIFKILQFVVVKTFQVFYSAKVIFDKNDWHRFKVKSQYECCIIPPIPLKMIHDIKNEGGVTFTTAILAIVTGAIRRMMIRKQARLPKTLRLGYPFPRSGHPDKLRNHFTAAMIDLPVGNDDPLGRLKKIEKDVTEIKKDLVTPGFFTAYATLIGGFFHWLLPPFASHYLYTGGLTNFPGPQEKVTFCGSFAKSADLCISIPRGNIAFGVGAISYVDKMYMSIQLNKTLVNKDENNLLEKYVFEEIELLRQCTKKQSQNSLSVTIQHI